MFLKFWSCQNSKKSNWIPDRWSAWQIETCLLQRLVAHLFFFVHVTDRFWKKEMNCIWFLGNMRTNSKCFTTTRKKCNTSSRKRRNGCPHTQNQGRHFSNNSNNNVADPCRSLVVWTINLFHVFVLTWTVDGLSVSQIRWGITIVEVLGASTDFCVIHTSSRKGCFWSMTNLTVIVKSHLLIAHLNVGFDAHHDCLQSCQNPKI